jgi:hypothetical protein
MKIKKEIPIKDLKKISLKSSNTKPFAAHTFCGAIKFNEDGLVIQKKMRDKWK